jgi:hypothetical protein
MKTSVQIITKILSDFLEILRAERHVDENKIVVFWVVAPRVVAEI